MARTTSVAFFVLFSCGSAIFCDDSSFSCPADFVLKGRPDGIECGSDPCTSEECCDPTTCSGITCDADSVKKTDADTVVCDGYCISRDCCAPLCSSFTCGSGFVQKASPDTIPCATDCDDATCCDATCSSFTCEVGTALIASEETTLCTDGTCSSAQCCSASCTGFACDVGSAPKDPLGTCVGSACTNAECCEASCVGFVCEPGCAPKDPPDSCAGDPCVDAECCEASCVGFACDEGSALKDTPEAITCAAAPCISDECCEVAATNTTNTTMTTICGGSDAKFSLKIHLGFELHGAAALALAKQAACKVLLHINTTCPVPVELKSTRRRGTPSRAHGQQIFARQTRGHDSIYELKLYNVKPEQLAEASTQASKVGFRAALKSQMLADGVQSARGKLAGTSGMHRVNAHKYNEKLRHAA